MIDRAVPVLLIPTSREYALASIPKDNAVRLFRHFQMLWYT